MAHRLVGCYDLINNISMINCAVVGVILQIMYLNLNLHRSVYHDNIKDYYYGLKNISLTNRIHYLNFILAENVQSAEILHAKMVNPSALCFLFFAINYYLLFLFFLLSNFQSIYVVSGRRKFS